ncbi:hypothetical protein H4R20_005630 [Coemansia guatemalensis]|uniref:Uncharacterized protein n=1 Tax=Coemansia guatemalensis TaxID=2761395 RepID=A0A9W8LRM8_9FUNG|nr:hypothetical protein H4R20_005630 [Coemansia guatemalensis]
MQLLKSIVLITVALAAAIHLACAADQQPQQQQQQQEQHEHFVPQQSLELTQTEARSVAAQLSRQFIDALYDLRTASENRSASVSNQARAKDSDDDMGGDEDDSTTKLINKAARAFRPIVKEFASVVNSALPAGPARQLVKATADAVDSLMPLILKYALGI